MEYVPLKKIYYKNFADYEKIYKERFNSSLARKLGITIKPYKSPAEYETFFCYHEKIALELEKIYKKYSELQEIINRSEELVLKQYALISIVDEVQSTNDIEGVKSTRRELKNIIDEHSHKSRFSSVVNKYRGLLSNEKFKFTIPSDIRRFYENFAYQEVIADSPDNKLDGKLFRLGSVDVTSATGKTIHRGVFPEKKIIQYMEMSLKILHNEDVPLLLRVAIFHYLFAYIHPFYDGNGRTDRFITAYCLAQHFTPLAVLRLSVIIKNKRTKYYKLFEEVENPNNRGDLTVFIIGFLEFIELALADAARLLKRKNEQFISYRQKLAALVNGQDELTKKLYDVLLQVSLFYGQGITITELIEKLNKARATIQKRLDNMPGNHLVISKINKKNYYKLNLFILK